MDEQLVLTALTLRLNPNIQRADFPNGYCVLKNTHARKYLTITYEQWNLLRNFGTPATVPDVLRAIIINRTCLPLREFYELILKANRAGVLISDNQTEPEIRPRRWSFLVHPWVTIGVGWASILATIISLSVKGAAHPSPFPLGVLDIIAGWLLLIIALSAGEALAASVLSWGGGEVYSPRFVLTRLIPSLKVNLDDTRMMDQLTQVGVWSARLGPAALVCVLLIWLLPTWSLLHTISLMIMLRPFLGGSVLHFFSALLRGHALDTHKALIFTPNRRWDVRFKFGRARVSFKYVAARIAWGAAWSFFAVYLTLGYFGISLMSVFSDQGYWHHALTVFVATSLFTLAAFLARPVYLGAKGLYDNLHAKWEKHRERLAVEEETSFDHEEILRLMSDSLVFRRIAPSERTDLIRLGRPQFFESRHAILDFTSKPTEIGIILSGCASVLRRVKGSRTERIIELKEGDIFGAHALLDPERPEIQIKSQTPIVAWMIPLAEFQQRVVTRLGTPLANDLTQKVPFLRNLSLCANWHPQAIARFAQIATAVNFNANELIMEERRDSQQFYLVYEGRVTVRRGNKIISRLSPGGYFGEISLLQNSGAVADVFTKEYVRCLTVNKSDFLRFMTHNPLVGLQVEEISSKRLGHPIFPLHRMSFETH